MNVETTKLIIIGIDGMDFDLYAKWKKDLPNLRKLSEQGISLPLESVYPPDSICAWTTIFTGLDPSEHGLLYTINYLNKNKEIDIDTSAFAGKTFWDIVGINNKRVCIVNPFLAYPPWKVNGVMVSGPVFIDGTAKSYPENVLYDYQIPELGGIVDFPTEKTLQNFLDKTKCSTRALTTFGKELYQKEEWNIFFITFLTLDRIKHFMWRYQDHEDPTYPGNNPFENSIKETYQYFDSIVGEFLEIAKNNTATMVLSDHGHQRRCYRIVNINEYLRRLGYLQVNIPSIKYFSSNYWIEKIKNLLLKTIVVFHLEDISSKLIKYIPYKSALKKGTFVTNYKDSVAFADVEFSGKNPSVGIRLNKEVISFKNKKYDDIREKIISEMVDLIDPVTGKKIALWVKKREDVYSGTFLERFPDILMQFEDNYGIDFALFGAIITDSVSHKKISGGHRFNGVLFLSPNYFIKSMKKYHLRYIFPLILDIMGIPNKIHKASQYSNK
jgi:predicted AlkP superfamily phosphohydrolase/phosphomutase